MDPNDEHTIKTHEETKRRVRQLRGRNPEWPYPPPSRRIADSSAGKWPARSRKRKRQKAPISLAQLLPT